MIGEIHRENVFTLEGLAGISANNALLRMISDLGEYSRGERTGISSDLVPLYNNLSRQLDVTSVGLALYPRTKVWDPSMLVGVAAYWAENSREKSKADYVSSYQLPAQYMQKMSEALMHASSGIPINPRPPYRYLTNLCVASQLMPADLRMSGLEKRSTPDPFRGVCGLRYAA